MSAALLQAIGSTWFHIWAQLTTTALTAVSAILPPAPPSPVRPETAPPVLIQTTPDATPALPDWLAELALVITHLRRRGVPDTIVQQVRLARRRMGTYDVLDVILLLLAYAISGEPSLHALYVRLAPVADVVTALFQRQHIPHRATVSRFLRAVDPACLAQLRQVMLHDLCAHGLRGDAQGGVWDQQGQRWLLFDVDATRQPGRQRALPTDPALPPGHRRLTPACAPGYRGRHRGEVVRTRTTVSQAHTHEWLGSFAGAGNGDYLLELTAAMHVIGTYLDAHTIARQQGLLRLDGTYGSLLVLAHIQAAGLGFVGRCKDYGLLRYPQVQARLLQPPTACVRHSESATLTEILDVGEITAWQPPVPGKTLCGRVIVMRSPVPPAPAQVAVGKVQDGWVYELFITSVPAAALSAPRILDLYHQRGAFEQVLADEDQEQDPDRWCCYAAPGQDCWQVISQWVWNLRLELGSHLHAPGGRWTRWDAPPPAPPIRVEPPAMAADPEAPSLPLPEPPTPPLPAAPRAYGPLELSTGPGMGGRYTSQAFVVTADGGIQCPAGQPLYPQERQVLATGDLRVRFAARTPTCRACPQRDACVAPNAVHGRRVTGIYRALPPPADPTIPAAAPDAAPTRAEETADPPAPTANDSPTPDPPVRYGPLELAVGASPTGRYTGRDFGIGPDGLPQCPAGTVLQPQERQVLTTGDLRVRFAAHSWDCRACAHQERCVGATVARGRRVTGTYRVITPPLAPPLPPVPLPPPVPDATVVALAQAPVWWHDAGGRQVRRALLEPLRRQQVTLTRLPTVATTAESPPSLTARPPGSGGTIMTRAERAHHRLSWAERLQRNARSPDAPRYQLDVPGVAPTLAALLGLPTTS